MMREQRKERELFGYSVNLIDGGGQRVPVSARVINDAVVQISSREWDCKLWVGGELTGEGEKGQEKKKCPAD